MRIVLYFINYNDSYYLPFIANHYGRFCEKIVMYDNYSTDNSVSTALHYGFEVRNFGMRGQLNDQHYLDVKNHCWKECRGKGIDYVIVCDADEFLFPIEYKFHMYGKPALPYVEGFNMISESLPINDIMELNEGSFSEAYSKQAMFNPDMVTEINYVHGCHKNHVVCEQAVNLFTNFANLYHYRMIGGVERIIQRHAEYRQRMSTFNKKHKMGFHYEHSDDAKRIEWNHLKSIATKLF